MKYAIRVNDRLTECVTVPPQREADPLAWLAVQFPGKSGWDNVADDATNGVYPPQNTAAPKPEPTPEPVPDEPPTQKQQILDQIAVLKQLADKLA